MFKNLLFIFIGGGLGSVLRFVISFFNANYSYGTFLANFLGCLLIGVFMALGQRSLFSQPVYLLLAVGFCGGFTTFSTFTAENYKMLASGDYLGFGIYSLGTFIICLLGLILGSKIAAAF
ncbi:CrcB family protein [Ornithobacterium rhinotracheale]|uniref:Fluoride-specific ion channel FluC n=1 Tax=Ornithobacterium rhinotracheale (strain ATCC 51463 / DSM 15997 / CCUG 23171 / CIP 104009 / LMG 9086) TaxID=867902 RepID=I4A3F0_ORNRL|nr:CrcB family protein [Ornithobacterium rhinotracheale]AFL98484.1 Integral membrane protein possibly involved in chromosome condensation [Ornithobacterium rhinotracheale DSM 15997]AIQ00209.1 camphor resistance protein CrcB [Ornithobacterium rhinotracheale ORT-UMN 88]KGB65785.1 camphor resistance protein CrcB [Ornithobacterium rhinotracheale H06-030791]MCK0193168.1 CrcB family protein [Ornithobacterium rhinotracheale]MCK0200911.1 CrcB family protein [Ornithobacterium rhinotracheale]